MSRAATYALLALLLAAPMAAAAAGCRKTQPPARQSGPGTPGLVRIAAAADLRFALDAILARLRAAHPSLDVRASYGSSGTFVAQLMNGAPFDVFLSADLEYPKQLGARGLTIPGSEFTYAVGRLAVWTGPSSPLQAGAGGFGMLTDARVAHVAIANPEHAPYGRAAQAAMTRAGVWDAVKGKLVLGDNVSQAMQFVESGAAEAGIVALSLALAPTMKDKGAFWVIPADEYPEMKQGGVVLKSAADAAGALLVRDFLQSGAAREVLSQYGFGLPEPPK